MDQVGTRVVLIGDYSGGGHSQGFDDLLSRPPRRVCEGNLRCLTMYFETVACEILMPSFRSSP